MIQVRFSVSHDNKVVSMEMKGHAGSAPKGEDLICASATMLAYTAAQAVQFLWENEQLQRKPKIRLEDGKAQIVAIPKEDSAAQVMHAFWVVQCGAHVLAHNYPGHVRLEAMRV